MLPGMTSEAVALDRRQRRRLETIEEVLDIAAQIMVEQGVAGLSVGEIARRMGIRPPSLYVYFPSKNALYDALFQRGAEQILATMQELYDGTEGSELTFEEQLLDAARAFVGWCVANPAYTQLLFWRPVPGFTPTPEAFEPAVQVLGLTTTRFEQLQAAGLIRADVDVADAVRDWTVVCSGVISQQLANAPGEDLEGGRFVVALPSLAAMFARHYGSEQPGATQPSARSRGRARHAHQR